MATHLTSSELHRLRNNFESIDIDGTGTITIEDLKKILAEGFPEGQDPLADVDLTHFDLDGDGQVDWREFVACVMQDHDLYNEDNLEKVRTRAAPVAPLRTVLCGVTLAIMARFSGHVAIPSHLPSTAVTAPPGLRPAASA